MRFGQMEIRTIAAMILGRCRLAVLPGHTISIRQMPTLSPRGGLPMLVEERDARSRGTGSRSRSRPP